MIPFKPDNPKSRLSSVFSEKERRIFVELSLENVFTVLRESGIHQIDILSKSRLPAEDENRLHELAGEDCFLKILIDDRDLSTAVNAYLIESADPVLIVMADLALLRREDVAAMISSVEESHGAAEQNMKLIRLAPGKDGGTNMIYIEAPDLFEVNYYGESCKKHREEAKRKNLACDIYKSFYAAADMDEPEDLQDIINHDGDSGGKLRDFVCAALQRNQI